MNQRKIKRQNLLGGILFGLFVTSVMLLSFGCSKKKSDGGTTSGIGYIAPGRTGYGGYGTVLFNAGAIDSMGRYFVIGSVATLNGYSGVGYVPAKVSGELRVYEGLACASDYRYGMNRGTYQLIPYDNQMANLNFNSINQVRMIARGNGIEAIVSIPYGFFFGNQICGLEGMQGQLIIEKINGNNCNLITNFNDVAPGGFCAG